MRHGSPSAALLHLLIAFHWSFGVALFALVLVNHGDRLLGGVAGRGAGIATAPVRM